jgi:hypothetical protein
MPTSELVLYSADAWLFTGFRLGALLVSDTHTHFTKYFGCHKFQASYFGGHSVTHDFGHSGDVSTSDVFRLPQGLFA